MIPYLLANIFSLKHLWMHLFAHSDKLKGIFLFLLCQFLPVYVFGIWNSIDMQLTFLVVSQTFLSHSCTRFCHPSHFTDTFFSIFHTYTDSSSSSLVSNQLNFLNRSLFIPEIRCLSGYFLVDLLIEEPATASTFLIFLVLVEDPASAIVSTLLVSVLFALLKKKT